MKPEVQTIPFLVALITVTITATAQIFLKYGTSSVQLRSGTRDEILSVWGTVAALAMNPFILGGVGLYGISAVLWVYVLSRLPLSQAYPFVGLSIVITSLVGGMLLGERLIVTQIIGIFMVSVGVLMVASA